MRRIAHMLVVIALVLGLCAVLTGCGAAPASPSTSSDLNASGTATTQSAGAQAAEALPEMADYVAKLKVWFHSYSTDLQAESKEALAFRDPAQPTESELLRARQFTQKMRDSVSQLAKISPPPQVAKAHAELYSALRGEADAVERYVNALSWGSVRDVELAMRTAEQAYGLYAQALQGLSPYLDLTGTLQN